MNDKKIWYVKVQVAYNGIISHIDWCNSSKERALATVNYAIQQFVVQKGLDPLVINADELKQLNEQNAVSIDCRTKKNTYKFDIFDLLYLTGHFEIFLTELQMDPIPTLDKLYPSSMKSGFGGLYATTESQLKYLHKV